MLSGYVVGFQIGIQIRQRLDVNISVGCVVWMEKTMKKKNILSVLQKV